MTKTDAAIRELERQISNQNLEDMLKIGSDDLLIKKLSHGQPNVHFTCEHGKTNFFPVLLLHQENNFEKLVGIDSQTLELVSFRDKSNSYHHKEYVLVERLDIASYYNDPQKKEYLLEGLSGVNISKDLLHVLKLAGLDEKLCAELELSSKLKEKDKIDSESALAPSSKLTERQSAGRILLKKSGVEIA